jgi:MATE family multidrug resistance protein
MLQRSNRRRYRINRPRPADRDKIKNLIRIGSPAAWESFIDMGAFSLFSVFIGQTGAVALASSQITIQLLAFSFMPMWGITIAGSVLTGNWIGEGKPGRASEYGRQVYKVGFYYTLVLAALLVLGRQHLFAIFSNDPAVLTVGAGLCLAAACFQIGDGLRMVSIGLLQGAGDTKFAMLLSLLLLWGLFVPLTYLLVIRWGSGVTAAWFGGTFCYLLQGVLLFSRFRSGRWQEIKIFSEPAGNQ